MLIGSCNRLKEQFVQESNSTTQRCVHRLVQYNVLIAENQSKLFFSFFFFLNQLSTQSNFLFQKEISTQEKTLIKKGLWISMYSVWYAIILWQVQLWITDWNTSFRMTTLQICALKRRQKCRGKKWQSETDLRNMQFDHNISWQTRAIMTVGCPVLRHRTRVWS